MNIAAAFATAVTAAAQLMIATASEAEVNGWHRDESRIYRRENGIPCAKCGEVTLIAHGDWEACQA